MIADATGRRGPRAARGAARRHRTERRRASRPSGLERGHDRALARRGHLARTGNQQAFALLGELGSGSKGSEAGPSSDVLRGTAYASLRQRRAAADPAPAPGHVLFVPGGERYRLLERDGAPPAVGGGSTCPTRSPLLVTPASDGAASRNERPLRLPDSVRRSLGLPEPRTATCVISPVGTFDFRSLTDVTSSSSSGPSFHPTGRPREPRAPRYRRGTSTTVSPSLNCSVPLRTRYSSS